MATEALQLKLGHFYKMQEMWRIWLWEFTTVSRFSCVMSLWFKMELCQLPVTYGTESPKNQAAVNTQPLL